MLNLGKKKEKVKKPKKYPSNVEERLKKIAGIESPEQNEFKMDNEDIIEKFMRFGMIKIPKKGSIKDQARNKF